MSGRLGRVVSKAKGKFFKVQCKNLTLDVPFWYIEQVDQTTLPQEFQPQEEDPPPVISNQPEEPQQELQDDTRIPFETSQNTLDLRGMVRCT